MKEALAATIKLINKISNYNNKFDLPIRSARNFGMKNLYIFSSATISFYADLEVSKP